MAHPKVKAVQAEDFSPRMAKAATVATTYAIDELGWVRAKAVAAIEDTLYDGVFLVKLEVGETNNPQHDFRTIALLVDNRDVTDEGEEGFWLDNAIRLLRQEDAMPITICYVVSETGLDSFEVFECFLDGNTLSLGRHYASPASARRAAQTHAKRHLPKLVPVFMF